MLQPEVKRFAISVLFVVVFLTGAGLRMTNLNMVEVKQFPDTQGYIRKASWPLWSWQSRFGPLADIRTWWLKGRSPTVPFFYKLAGNEPRSIAVFQSVFSILSWGLLALMVSQSVQSYRLKSVAFLIILMFSLTGPITIWDGFLLSDSISISLMALFIAGWLWLVQSWHWGKALVVVSISILWAFSRDSNAWVILMAASSLIVVASLGRSFRYLFIAAVFVTVFAANEISQNYSQRWVMPFLSVVGRRILPDAERTAYFAHRGMPVSPALMQLSGQLAWGKNRAFYNDPALEEFRAWAFSTGKSNYTQFLLAHPGVTLLEPLRNIRPLIVPNLSYYRSGDFSAVDLGVRSEFIYFEEWALPWVLASGIIIGFAFVLVPQTPSSQWLVPLLMVLFAYPHAAIVWHGDPNDIGRHGLQAGIQFRLGLWMLVLFAVDRLFVRKISIKG